MKRLQKHVLYYSTECINIEYTKYIEEKISRAVLYEGPLDMPGVRFARSGTLCHISFFNPLWGRSKGKEGFYLIPIGMK